MAEKAKALDIDCAIISVDTFLGAWDHWLSEQFRGDLKAFHGYPTLFYTFMANVVAKELNDIVVPMPLDSNNAAEVLRRQGIRPDVVHVDAGHDRKAVLADLELWWDLLAPGGYLIGDDYDPSFYSWPEVAHAFHEFFQTTQLENYDGKCRVRKMVAR